jgi:hypothetical protein
MNVFLLALTNAWNQFADKFGSLAQDVASNWQRRPVSPIVRPRCSIS